MGFDGEGRVALDCCACGTRNDLREFEGKTVADIGRQINIGGPNEDCVRDTVSAFDSLIGSYARQLAQRIPMRPRRKARTYLALQPDGTKKRSVPDGI
jgi:hypothetical protein